jgi:RimK family alpha-L-glutamate ligase
LETAIDKLATLIAVQREGWRVPNTVVCQSRAEGLEAFDRLGGDVVIKPMLGSEGRGVMRVHDKDLAWTTLTALERVGAVLYLQQFVPPGGRDLRILVWGKELFAVRRSNPQDWRTNVSRGASCENVAVPQQLADPLRNLAKKLGLIYGAIDFVEDQHGEPLLLEVNAVPGWQGSQRTLSVNLAEILLGLCNNGV